MSFTRSAHSIVLAWGWQRAAIAFVAGAFSVLALPPIDIWPVMFITFPVLVWLIDGAGSGRWGGILAAAVTGWWFGFGYFLAGLYWVGYAFLVDAETFGWLLPVAVAGLPAGLALFHGARLRAGPGDVDARTGAHSCARGRLHPGRMAPGPYPHRFPLEHLRLCAHRAIGAGADRFPVWDLGPHFFGRQHFRQSSDTHR